MKTRVTPYGTQNYIVEYKTSNWKGWRRLNRAFYNQGSTWSPPCTDFPVMYSTFELACKRAEEIYKNDFNLASWKAEQKAEYRRLVEVYNNDVEKRNRTKTFGE